MEDDERLEDCGIEELYGSEYLPLTEQRPLTLTIEEYQRIWQPEGWRLLPIGPTSTWREEWGVWEAIRDIVQNALDETEGYQWGYDDDGLWISDKGKGVAVADFLLGPPKLKPAWARGRFGEGMKIASLALVRADYPVHVRTMGREIWIVFLEQRVNGSAYQLAALWRHDGSQQGTTFHIIGYTGTAYEDRFTINLPRSLILFEAPSPMYEPIKRYNQLIDLPSGFQRIYARDIYMREIATLYSYNLWGFDMAPDRQAPKDEKSMWLDIGRLWCCINKVGLLKKFLEMMVEPPKLNKQESHHLSMDKDGMGNLPGTTTSYSSMVKVNIQAWRGAWEETMGSNAVIRTKDRWDGTVKHLGYRGVTLQWDVADVLSQAIMTDSALVKNSQEKLREVEVIPDDSLSLRQLRHLTLARAIVAEWYYPPVHGVHAAIIPPASDRVRTAGLYQRSTTEIFIASDQLERAAKMVDCVIHELAHHTSQADDLETGHAEAMTQVGSRVMMLTADNRFVKYLEHAVW